MKMNIEKNIGFIGSGNMGSAIIARLAKRMSRSRIHIFDIDAAKCEILKKRHRVTVSDTLLSLADKCDIIILAVKPDKVAAVLESIKNNITGKIIVSIAAGFSIQSMEGACGSDKKIIRVMPNTPSLAGEGMAALSPNKNVTENEMNTVDEIFKMVGKTVIIEEKHMDAVTGLSGSGPAYVFTFIQALADGGVKMGLPRDTAQLLAAQTVLGSARLVLESADDPITLRSKVASPGGTTIEGIHVLEKAGFSGTVMDAVEAAVMKSKSLGA